MTLLANLSFLLGVRCQSLLVLHVADGLGVL